MSLLPDAVAGLSGARGRTRLGEAGFNELPSSKPKNVLRITGEILREPILLLLVACSAVYFLLGDIREARCTWAIWFCAWERAPQAACGSKP